MDNPQKPSPWRRKALPIYMAFMFLAPMALFPLAFGGNFEILGYVYGALLLGLFAVLLFTPSNSQELDRVLDTEASAVTLGMTLYSTYFYPVFEEAFSAPKFHPYMVVVFILVTYTLARQILRFKYR